SLVSGWPESNGPVARWRVTPVPGYTVKLMGPPLGTVVAEGFSGPRMLSCPVEVVDGTCSPPPGLYGYDLRIIGPDGSDHPGGGHIELMVTAAPADGD